VVVVILNQLLLIISVNLSLSSYAFAGD